MPTSNAVNFELVTYTPPVGSGVNFELVQTQPHRKLFSWGASGKIGRPDMPNTHGHYGIYQMRMTKRGKVPVRMKFYVPTNPRTVPQQANRTKFADAMQAWMALTPTAKEPYYRKAKKLQKRAHGLFIKEYFINN